jgi:hydroxyacylglutathione hydrolase
MMKNRPAITNINLGGVNCYLIKTGKGYVLIDTGFSNKRGTLEKKLAKAGCQPGVLKLIILTHGDMDHAGNAAYLRDKFGSKIAMHANDSGVVAAGDMTVNRKKVPDRVSLIFKIMSALMPLLGKQFKFDVFKPDLIIDEGFDLSKFGLEARIIHLPGHSKGSIGVLTAGGEIFCGDLLYNMPGFSFIDNLVDHRASLKKLRKMDIKTIYPGHGKPFSKQQFLKKYR